MLAVQIRDMQSPSVSCACLASDIIKMVVLGEKQSSQELSLPVLASITVCLDPSSYASLPLPKL